MTQYIRTRIARKVFLRGARGDPCRCFLLGAMTPKKCYTMKKFAFMPFYSTGNYLDFRYPFNAPLTF